jgi:hypothetical protein
VVHDPILLWEIWAQQKTLWAYAEVYSQHREDENTLAMTDPYYSQFPDLMQETLTAVEPWVRHGMWEAQAISTEHALREAAAVTYLIGRGYYPEAAHQIVESWWHRP